MKVFLESLGCAKNLVDSEKILSLFNSYNHTITTNPLEAEIIIINTCGFINSAREESINIVFEYSLLKKNSNLKTLILTGCLAEIAYNELKNCFYEVDYILKINEFNDFLKKIDNNAINNNNFNRILTTPKGQAYLKIAEGCSQNCSFCTIPLFKGKFRSFKFEDIIEEVNFLVKKGVKEINLIAQDLTSYGLDINLSLSFLLNSLCKIPQLKWIRLLYTYPDKINKELITVISQEEKICKYIDIPFQHLDDQILKKMRRWGSYEKYKDLIYLLREKMPDIAIRTTFIVGFPGETEEAFNNLIERVNEIKFDRLGVFEYSDEKGTASYKLKNKVDSITKKERYNELMRVQMEISEEILSKRIGQINEVIVEDIDTNGICICRSQYEAPEVDGLIFVKNKNAKIGDFINVKITNLTGGSVYDLDGIMI